MPVTARGIEYPTGGDAASGLAGYLADLATGTTSALQALTALPQDFGAVGNGVADDTTAIQAALDSLTYGGTCWLPPGTYKVTALNVPAGVVLAGASPSTSVLTTSSATANVVTLNGSTALRNVKVTSSATRTAGSFVYVKGNSAAVEHCQFTNYLACITVGNYAGGIKPVATRILECDFASPRVAAGGYGIYLDNFSTAMVSGCVMSGPALPGTQPDAGISVNNGDTATIERCNITLHGRALRVSPTAGLNCYALHVESCLFDSAGTVTGGSAVACCDIRPAGSVFNTKMVNSWFGLSQAQAGCTVIPTGAGLVDGILWTGCEFIGNGTSGLLVSIGGKNWAATGCLAAGNTSYGINAANGTTDFAITNCVIGNAAGRGANGYGINIVAAAADRYVIQGNILTNNTSGPMYDGGTGVYKVIKDNVGLNPRGVLGPPAVPASTVALFNPYGGAATVYVTGGTVSDIKVGASTVPGVTSGPVPVPAAGSITLTYTVAPTWTWFVQ